MKIVNMWLLPVLLGSCVVEARKFTREPTDTTTTVGDKAVLRFGMKLFLRKIEII